MGIKRQGAMLRVAAGQLWDFSLMVAAELLAVIIRIVYGQQDREPQFV